MTTTVLVLVETINDYLPIIENSGFTLILAPTPAERAKAIATHGEQINAVLTRGPLVYMPMKSPHCRTWKSSV